MKRSKLYELVWSKPMTKLGAELGISDVGLAKACRRHAIPVPPRGHWAKLQAGKASPKVQLPQAELDIEVSFTTVPPAQRQSDVVRQREAKTAVAEKTVALRAAAPVRKEVDQRPHPLVRATRDYCSRLPARVKRWERMSSHQRLYTDGERPPPNENGRWILNVPDGLILTVSEETLTWALGFLDCIFKGLEAAGVKVVRQAGKDREPDAIECVFGQERLKLSFREGYRRVKLTAAEFAQAKAKESWARERVYLPSRTFTLTFQGTEHGVSKGWTGTQDKLSPLEEEIIATGLLLLEAQPKRREERLAEERRRRIEAEKAEQRRRIAQGRREQLERAFKAAEAYEKVERLQRFLAVVESENFKLNLGESAPGRLEPPRFETGDGKQRSAHEITKTYFEGVLRQATAWINDRGLKPAARVLVAEPLSLDQGKEGVHDWLANYRSRVRSILSPFFLEVDFLPEPFAVFQYYRYGVKHPLIAERKRHAALVVDFGGGTFDVSVVDTTATGDVSGGGRNSRPLAASSIPVGGSFINLTIARELIARNLDKGADKNKLERAWQLYRSGAEAVGGAQALAPDFRQFIRNVKRVVAQVEQAKVHIVEGIADWSIDAAYEPSPASLISVPKNPFADKPALVDVRFDAVQLRDTFTKRVWAPHLRATLIAAIERASADLSDRPINLILLSGGSANIRWLSTLIEAELRDRLPMAEILELHSSFQEVVSKGLAIECARKTFNGVNSDFKAVTYNRLCMVLGSDGDPPRAYRFKPVEASVQERDQGEGTLLHSSFAIGACIDKPIRWKFRLQSPPKRYLDYYFLKSSLDFGDVSSLQNVDHRIYTPPRTDFDSAISLQLEVREDGTATPTFIYKQGRTEAETIAVKGQSFYLDMTFGKATTLGEAYVGFDFGTSNSSVSYVEQSAVRQYTQRAGEAGWRELNELIGSLPYPAANPLGKFLGATADRDQRDRFAEAFESMLCLIASIAYVDYINGKGSRQTGLFKQLRKLSAGPLWGFIRGIIEQKPKESRFRPEFQRLISSDCERLINLSIDAINDHKHHRVVSFVDYYRVLGLLGNTLNNALAGWRFGGFDEVKKKGFSSKRSGLFRAAHGSHSPFVEIFRYEGTEDFSDLEAVLVSQTTGEAFRLAPFIFWTPPDSRGERTIAVLDSVTEDEANYRTVEGGQAFSASQESDLSALFAQCRQLSTRDEALEPVVCTSVGLTARSA